MSEPTDNRQNCFQQLLFLKEHIDVGTLKPYIMIWFWGIYAPLLLPVRFVEKKNKKSWHLKLKDATNLIVVFDVLGKYGSQEALLWLCRRLTTPRYIRNCFGNSLQFQKWFDCATETLRKTNRKVPWVFTTGYRVLGWLMGNCLWPLQPFPGRKGYCFNCCQLQQLQRIIYCFLWQKALWFLWTDGFPIIYPKGQTSHVHKSFSPLNVCLC